MKVELVASEKIQASLPRQAVDLFKAPMRVLSAHGIVEVETGKAVLVLVLNKESLGARDLDNEFMQEIAACLNEAAMGWLKEMGWRHVD